LSRIIYDINTAAVVIIIDGFYRGIIFFKKNGDDWVMYTGDRIPFKIGEEDIIL